MYLQNWRDSRMIHFFSKEVYLLPLEQLYPPIHMHTNLHQHQQILFCALLPVSLLIVSICFVHTKWRLSTLYVRNCLSTLSQRNLPFVIAFNASAPSFHPWSSTDWFVVTLFLYLVHKVNLAVILWESLFHRSYFKGCTIHLGTVPFTQAHTYIWMYKLIYAHMRANTPWISDACIYIHVYYTRLHGYLCMHSYIDKLITTRMNEWILRTHTHTHTHTQIVT